MFGSQVLDTGIGLAMLFAFMSLIATSLNEAIETFLKARAKQLEQGIRNILEDPDGTKKVVDEFFNNPFVTILYSGRYDSRKLQDDRMMGGQMAPSESSRAKSMPVAARTNLPSYIPSSNFAMAIVSMIVKDGPRTAANVRAALTTPGTSPLQDTAIAKLTLNALDLAQNDLEMAQKHLEEWYDASMDRVSGWYKKRTQYILFGIGIFAAIVMNVDAIQVGRSLMSDPSLREALVAQAANLEKPPSENSDKADPVKQLQAMKLPIGWEDAAQLNDKQARCTGSSTCIGMFIGSIYSGSATGWSMILGWLITAFAIMLGAPFWFDLLNKFMQLRAATNSDDKKKKKQ